MDEFAVNDLVLYATDTVADWEYALARAGLLYERDHTSNAPDFLASSGYAGSARYVDAPTVTSESADARVGAGVVITAPATKPVDFSAAVFRALKMIAAPAGLTPAWWQVLGATLREPLPVAEIARRVGLGLARQSVQRVADLLVENGWATYAENPHHKRAKLLQATEQGRATVRGLAADQHAWADHVGSAGGADELSATLATVHRIVEASREYRALISAAPAPE